MGDGPGRPTEKELKQRFASLFWQFDHDYFTADVVSDVYNVRVPDLTKFVTREFYVSKPEIISMDQLTNALVNYSAVVRCVHGRRYADKITAYISNVYLRRYLACPVARVHEHVRLVLRCYGADLLHTCQLTRAAGIKALPAMGSSIDDDRRREIEESHSALVLIKIRDREEAMGTAPVASNAAAAPRVVATAARKRESPAPGTVAAVLGFAVNSGVEIKDKVSGKPKCIRAHCGLCTDPKQCGRSHVKLTDEELAKIRRT